MTRNRLCFGRPAEAHQRVSDIAVCSIPVVSLDLIDERIEPAYPCRIWIFRKLRQRDDYGITIEHLEINFLLVPAERHDTIWYERHQTDAGWAGTAVWCRQQKEYPHEKEIHTTVDRHPPCGDDRHVLVHSL